MDGIVNPFDGEIANIQIETWLEQFEPTEIPYITYLLPHFRYYSSRRFELIINQLPNKIKTQSGRDPLDFFYIPIGQIEDSGTLALYLYRQIFSPSQINTLSITDLKENMDIPLILFDDFIETGEQANLIWEKIIKPNHFTNQVILVAVVGASDGMEYLKHKTDFLLVVGEIIDMPRPLQNHSKLTKSDSKILYRIMQKYHNRFYPSGIYSKKIDSCSLVGFFYNTPESTFPIFWSTVAGWKPLLPHRSNAKQNEEIYEEKESSVIEQIERSSLVEIDENVNLPEAVITQFIYEFHELRIVNCITPVFAKLSVETGVIINLMTLIHQLKHAVHEKSDIRTALFIPNLDRTKYYKEKSIIDIEEKLRINQLEKAETIATVFDGLATATVVSPNGEILGAVTYNDEQVSCDPYPSRYMKPLAISKDGCLILFLGRDRVQLFAYGEILVTHRGANWYPHSKESLKKKITLLSERHSVSESVIEELIRVAYLISDDEKGAIFTVGNHDNVLQNSDFSINDGYTLRRKKLNQISDEALIGLMSQDKATVITAEGVVLQNRTSLVIGNKPIIEEPGKGTKHKTAASVSASTGAICFAVSATGSISIYSEGLLIHRTII